MSRQWNSETIFELNDDTNLQLTPEQLNFLDGVGLQRYEDTLRVERPNMSSRQGIRNATDENQWSK